MGIKVYQVKSAASGFGMFQRSAEAVDYEFLDTAKDYAAWVAQENNLVYSYSLDADEAEMGDEDGEKLAVALREVDGRVQGGQGKLVAFLIGDEVQIESVEEVRKDDEPKVVYVYNENCVMAGRAVPMRELGRYEDPSDGNDWHAEKLTAENADEHDAPGKNIYHGRIAATIRDMLGIVVAEDSADE